MPQLEQIATVIKSLHSLTPSVRFKAIVGLFQRILYMYSNIEYSPKWNEAKLKWPDYNTEEIQVKSMEDLLNRAMISQALYENSMMMALDDLLKGKPFLLYDVIDILYDS